MVGLSTVVPGKGPIGVQGQYDYKTEYTNQPADPRLNDIVTRKAPNLRTGLIQNVDKFAGDAHHRTVKFMFNPAVVQTTYSVADGVTPMGELTVDQAKGLAVYPGQTSVSFSLLFDRTFDVYYGPSAKGGLDLRDMGVAHDVAHLEAVTGCRSNQNFSVVDTAGTPDTATADASKGSQIMGNMLMVPVYVIFGGGQYSPAPGLSYVGFITSMTVNWGLFSSNMIPTRCAVDLTLQQLVGKDVQDFGAEPDSSSAYRTKF